MLPWLFAVLLALNLALFWWGRQHEVPIEPQLPPLPEAPHQIQILGSGSGPDLSPAAGPTEPPAPWPGMIPATDESAPPEPVAQTEPGQAGTGSGDAVAALDEGAPPDAPPLVKLLEPPTPEKMVAEPPRVYFPDPDPTEDQGPGTAPGDGAEPGLEAALPAAAAPEAVKKRKAKRRASTPPPAAPVELPLEFP
jgi:hypothetical protein